MSSYLYLTPAPVISLALFVFIIIFHIIGNYISSLQSKRKSDQTFIQIGTLEGAMLGLLSLLLAFTFNKAASNYDTRKEIIMEEANSIGTVLLRTYMYPDSISIPIRNDLKEYIIARREYFNAGYDENKNEETFHKAELIAQKIFLKVSNISNRPDDRYSSFFMIPVLNNMIDIMNKREMIRKSPVPESIIWLLLILVVIGSFIIGYASKSNKINWVAITLYALMTVLTVSFILDLDRPRDGWINTLTHEHNIDRLIESFPSQ